ncbi:MAG TPA: XRE family transcriptional regulator, partial [Mycobacteriales bacterium]|nr:XRE family transcriptional regulator [Mycobacteriales bacterium]
MRAVLDAGRRALDNKPAPAHPEHHFVIDPDKWNFYAMDCYRVTGMNELAAEHATEVLRVGRMPDGSDRWPMRTAEARVALAVVAVRSGDLERTIG